MAGELSELMEQLEKSLEKRHIRELEKCLEYMLVRVQLSNEYPETDREWVERSKKALGYQVLEPLKRGQP